MSFQLMPNTEAESVVVTETLARDAVIIANEFDADVLKKYKAMYESYWLIGTEITQEQLQARSARMGPTELAILLKAGAFVQAMTLMGVPLESKYYSPPREYQIVDVVFANGHSEATVPTFSDLHVLIQQNGLFVSGRLVLGDFVGEWNPQPQEEQGSENGNE